MDSHRVARSSRAASSARREWSPEDQVTSARSSRGPVGATVESRRQSQRRAINSIPRASAGCAKNVCIDQPPAAPNNLGLILSDVQENSQMMCSQCEDRGMRRGSLGANRNNVMQPAFNFTGATSKSQPAARCGTGTADRQWRLARGLALHARRCPPPPRPRCDQSSTVP